MPASKLVAVWVFPLGAAFVSAAFAIRVGAGWVRARRASMLAWTLALVLFATASAATAVGMTLGWSPGLFRLYYTTGAVLTAPILAVGTIYVLTAKKVAHVCALFIGAACVASVAFLAVTDVHDSALATSGIPHAGDALDLSTRNLSRALSYGGYVVVAGGAVLSAVRFARRRDPRSRDLSAGNALIALGTTIVAAGSAAARLGRGSVAGSIFSVALLIGVAVMFAGFLRTSNRRRA